MSELKALYQYSDLNKLDPILLTEIGSSIAMSFPTNPEVNRFAMACLQIASINCIDNVKHRAASKVIRERIEVEQVSRQPLPAHV